MSWKPDRHLEKREPPIPDVQVRKEVLQNRVTASNREWPNKRVHRSEASGTERTMMDEAAVPLRVPQEGKDTQSDTQVEQMGRKMRADFWQADAEDFVSLESVELLLSFVLWVLGPVSLTVLVLQVPQKFLSNNLVQAFSQTGPLI